MRSTARFAVTVLMSIVLTGCGNSSPSTPGPARDTAPTNSPTASVAAHPTPPPLPANATADTKAGAVAFVRHYIDLLNYAQATGELSPATEVESADCRSCKNYRRALEQIYGLGGSIQGGALRFRLVDVERSQGAGRWFVAGLATAGPQIVRTPGQPTRRLKGGRGPISFFVDLSDGKFRIVEWVRGS